MSPPLGPPHTPHPPRMSQILPLSILENISNVDATPPQRVTAATIAGEMTS